MIEFKIRPNASRLDLNERMEWYEEARVLLMALGQAHRFREPYLVSLIRHYFAVCAERKAAPDKQFFLDCITAWDDRGMQTKSRLVAMLEGREPLEFKKKAPVEEMPGKHRRSEGGDLKRLSEMMNDLPADFARTPQGASGGSDQVGKHKFYSRDQAARWMMDNRPDDIEHWEDFFTFAGVQPGVGEIYYLQSGHGYTLRSGMSLPRSNTKPTLDEQEDQLQ